MRRHRLPGRTGLRSALTCAILALGLTLAGQPAASFAATALASPTDATEPSADAEPGEQLYLVTLAGPGASAQHGEWSTASRRLQIRAVQDATLARISGPEPVYRWTDALNGFAVRLTPGDAETLTADPGVALVEPNEIRKLASLPTTAATAVNRPPLAKDGAGQVIGIVDSGIWADGPLFGDPRAAKSPRFRGSCAQVSAHWQSDWCNGKVAGASWFVDGFGVDRIASAATLSPADDIGHGTKVASIAAGNGGVAVRTGTGNLGDFRGVAPRARIASYKACWSAPNPSDDGCSTADLVTAIDQATADRVDVMNLSVQGSVGGQEVDTVERALLGAAEADIAVVAAAGNDGTKAHAGHAVPWVTTVGGVSGPRPVGAVAIHNGPRLTGTMTARRSSDRARIVLASRVAQPGVRREDAERCLPGSLNAARVAGKIVLCLRGQIGRIDKSATVAQAGGIAMVLVNPRPGRLGIDMHRVPTVHLGKRDGARLIGWLTGHPRAKARLVPSGVDRVAPTVLAFSPAGDPAGDLVKPDLVAPAFGIVAGTRAPGTDTRFDYLTGTSAASAEVAGLAAVLRAQHPTWSAAQVRSALTSSAQPLSGAGASNGELRSGAGRAAAQPATRARIVVAPQAGDYRRYLDGDIRAEELNTPSIMLRSQRVITRTLTNLGQRARYYSSGSSGFETHQVTVRPAAVRLAPGESATFTVRVAGPRVSRTDQGIILWRGGDGTEARIPMVISR